MWGGGGHVDPKVLSEGSNSATLTTFLVGEGAERIQIPLKAGHSNSVLLACP